jgi:hypothetical protein
MSTSNLGRSCWIILAKHLGQLVLCLSPHYIQY